MTLQVLLDNIGIEYISDSDIGAIEIENISDDSRSEEDNALFVAIKGTLSDGHDYLAKLGNNFKAAIVENRADKISIPQIKTSDTRLALALAANEIIGNPSRDITNIGVTGTNGKTTVSYIINYLINNSNKISSLIGTTGIFIGDKMLPATHTTPSPIKLAELFGKLKEENSEYSVMEVSSHALHQHRTAGIEFSAGIFTNLSQDHLDYHGTMEEYAKAKKMLFDSLSEKALAVVYSGDDYAEYMISDTKAKKIKIGFSKDDDYSIDNFVTTIDGTTISLIQEGKAYNIRTNLIGKFNVINTVLSIATLNSLGFDIEKLINTISGFRGVPGRMEIFRMPNGSIGVVDYAHTPDALENALKTLNNIDGANQIICVFGCGGDRDRTKRPQMGRIAEYNSDKIIITNDNPRTEDPDAISEDIIEGLSNPENAIKILDRKEAIKKAYSISEKNDIILIAGKGHEDYQIIGKEKIHFSDQEILLELIG